jgi:hypothetical protein
MVNLLGLKCPMFVDTDFYLQFVKTYFYSDWQLVARLLDDTIADVGSLGPIVDQLQQRLHSLASVKRRSEEAENLEKEMLAGDSRLELKTSQAANFVTYERLHDESDPESQLGKSRLQSLFRELFDSDDNDLVELDILTRKLWSTITLGHSDLEARTIEQHLDLLHEGKPIFRINSPKSLKPGWSGKIGTEIVADTSPIGLFLFLTNEKGLTISLGLGEVPGKLKDSFVHAGSRQLLVERDQQLAGECA